MIAIPEELINQFERGNVLLFIGEQLLTDPTGREVFDRLTTELVSRLQMEDLDDLKFPVAAQAYEDEKGRQALVQLVRDRLATLGEQPQPVHHVIASLTDCTVIVTTCIDQRLETEFRKAGRPLDIFIANTDVAFDNARHTDLFKLRGSIERLESLVLTEDDYERFFETQENISIVLQGYLARMTILFVGYDLGDLYFRRLYRKMIAPLDNLARRSYAFGVAPSPRIHRWCDRNNIELVAINPVNFLEELAAQVTERMQVKLVHPTASVAIATASVLLPQHPYKLLDYYETTDAAIFFGRAAETRTLGAMIHAHRLVLLYGASGAGKTSLLLAGVVPWLEAVKPPYKAIYVRALDDPDIVIRQAIRRQFPTLSLPADGSLTTFLYATTTALNTVLLLIFDQFEEFFIRLSPQFRTVFIQELGELYDAQDMQIKVVLSLREDWLASIHEFEQRIPGIFRNRLRLLPLTREQARDAIIGPVSRLGVHYKPALVTRLLDDLAGREGDAIMPPQLQLICSALYSHLAPNNQEIDIADYEQLGGVRGVLQQYLADELERLPRDERVVAHALLAELVTSQGTKAVKTKAELALGLAVDSATLHPILERLVQARLLRVFEHEGTDAAYELAHEYLIREIGMSGETKRRKEAEELIRQEVENWQRFGTVVASDKLVLLNELRQLLRLNDEAVELLLRSSLQVDYEVDYWLERLEDDNRLLHVLTDAAHSRIPVVRQRAALLLGKQNLPEVVELLLTLATHESHAAVRGAAHQGLGLLTPVQQAAAVASLQNKIETSIVPPAYALEALTRLPQQDLPPSLRLRVVATWLRMKVVWAAQTSVATPTRRALVTIIGIFAVILLAAYVFTLNSYHLALQSSAIPGQQEIIVQRGHPWLAFLGANRKILNTGIAVDQINPDYWNDINNGKFAGFWRRNVDGSYHDWGQKVEEVLYTPFAVKFLWHLEQKEESFQKVFVEQWLSANYQFPSQAEALRDVGIFHAGLASQIADQLLSLIGDGVNGIEASQAFADLLALHPDLATVERNESLLKQLSVADQNSLSEISAALGHLWQANSILVTPETINQLTALLASTPSSEMRSSVISLLDDAVNANPQLATQALFDMLWPMVVDKKTSLSVRTAVINASATILKHNSELSSTIVITQLNLLLDDKKADLQSSAASALGNIVEARSDLATAEVGKQLQLLLKNRNSAVRAAAAYALGQLISANPTLLSQELAESLFTLLTTDNIWVITNAAPTLEVMMQLSPELVDSEWTQPLVVVALDPTSNYFSDNDHPLAPVLERLLAISPAAGNDVIEAFVEEIQKDDFGDGPFQYQQNPGLKSITRLLANDQTTGEQLVIQLLALIADEDFSGKDIPFFLLYQMVVVNPSLVTPEMVDVATKFLSEEKLSETTQDAAILFGTMTAITPSIATTNLVNTLTGRLTTSESYERAPSLNTLRKAISANPTTVAPALTQAIQNLLIVEDEDLRELATATLAVVYSKQALQAGNTGLLFDKLYDPLIPNERSAAARALFYIAREKPDEGARILQRLNTDGNSQEPLKRLWANQTRQMIQLLPQFIPATSQPLPASKLKEMLEFGLNLRSATYADDSYEVGQRYEIYFDNAYDYQQYYHHISFGASPLLFGQDFTWAAWQVLALLNEQSEAVNNQP
jgi:HEAT repeat protein